MNALYSVNAQHRKHKNDNKELINFYATPSIPCFELWLLLHFVPVRGYMHRHEIQRVLSDYDKLPDYAKGERGYFDMTRHRLEVAYKHADLLTANDPMGSEKNTEKPYTSVGKLVQLLTSMNTR